MYIFSYKHLTSDQRKQCNIDLAAITSRHEHKSKSSICYCYDENDKVVIVVANELEEMLFEDKDQHLMFQIKYGA